MHGVYIGDNRVLVQTRYGGRLVMRSDDLSMAPELLLTGVHEGNRSRPRQSDRSGRSIPYFVGSIVARGVVHAFHLGRPAAHERGGARSA